MLYEDKRRFMRMMVNAEAKISILEQHFTAMVQNFLYSNVVKQFHQTMQCDLKCFIEYSIMETKNMVEMIIFATLFC